MAAENPCLLHKPTPSWHPARVHKHDEEGGEGLPDEAEELGDEGSAGGEVRRYDTPAATTRMRFSCLLPGPS